MPMEMDLSQAVRDSIRINLDEAIGEELRQHLEKARQNIERISELEAHASSQHNRILELEKESDSHGDISARQAALDISELCYTDRLTSLEKKEHQQACKQEVLDMQSKLQERHVERYLDLVKNVFQNNHYKYHVTGTTRSGEYHDSKIEGEGQVPPIL